MYKTTILGKELVISNKAYEALVRKWRVEGIKHDEMFDEWEIRGKCSFCESFKNTEDDKCLDSCPFYKFSWRDIQGCIRLLRKITPRKSKWDSLDTEYFFWDTKKAAIACVSAVETELKKFKKVK